MQVSETRILLLGPMGVGKTTVGSVLAARLGVPFVDSDRALTAKTGRDAAAIAEKHGVAELHRLEVEVAVEAMTSRNCVVAAAASVADHPAVLERLRGEGAAIVYLDADADDVHELARHGEHRRRMPADQAAALAVRRRTNAREAGAYVIGRAGTATGMAAAIEGLVTPRSSS